VIPGVGACDLNTHSSLDKVEKTVNFTDLQLIFPFINERLFLDFGELNDREE
jgi:hypothetical protein